ncbi:peptidoglycan D,D-transpeptidase FtsI family protein [Bacillus sp. T33-2]|uniref:peptidoglycan D,D-transpeptidase FtsI family protein n=1 Tax=Bacillus sp. T33-2 TaxID=2054168 RepID=UPI003F8D765E
MAKKKSPAPFRINLLFFIIFILFSVLVLRLGIVQIVHGENYKREIEKKEDVTVNNPVPRGVMLDRNLKTVVDNTPRKAITYTNEGAKPDEMLEVAANLAKLIYKKPGNIPVREKKDYWIMKNRELAEKKITKKERALQKADKLKDTEIYDLILSRITEEELNQLTEEDMEVLAIFRIMNKGYKFEPQIIKNEDVTAEEFAVVSEHLEVLPGVDTRSDWDRSYPFNSTLASVLGSVTSYDKGLPAEKIDYYLSRGYSRNDRVGKSYLEMQYEDVLRGQKEKIVNITDKAGNVLETQLVSKGEKGKALVLSIDMELQQGVEKFIEDQLWKAKAEPGTHLLDRAYVVLMDPRTGDVLTMAGKRIVKNPETGKPEMEDDALGTITTTYNAGSAVKGATVFTGFKTGAISPGKVFNDAGIRIKGTPQVKKSWTYLGDVNDISALEQSSNVYMFHTAIKIGGAHYAPGEPLDLSDDAFEIMRNSFASFGLGVKTGIDLPNEQHGFKGGSRLPGHLLDLSIGQYDTYSAMQLAQYVSTIANGGYRMQPHMVKEIREPGETPGELGPIVMDFTPKVLNTIDNKKNWLERIQTGFRRVMTSGTADNYFSDKTYSPAGKTGTAEAFYDGPLRKNYGKEPPLVMNLSLVAYAPAENPEIAMAVIVPWAYQGKETHKSNLVIGENVMDLYFALKNQRQQANNTAAPVQNP